MFLSFAGRHCRTQIDPCGDDGETGNSGNNGGNPCKNGGECVPTRRWRNGGGGSFGKQQQQQQQQQQTYSCICPLGYSGENCEVSTIRLVRRLRPAAVLGSTGKREEERGH